MSASVCSVTASAFVYFDPCSTTLRVVTLPSPRFDGSTSVTFRASGMGTNATDSARFNFTFFHCEKGQAWNDTMVNDGDYEACKLCSDIVQGETEVRGYVAVL